MSKNKKYGNKRKEKQVKTLSNQVLPTKELMEASSFNFFFLTEDPDIEKSTIAYWEKERLFSKHLTKFQSYSKRSLKSMLADRSFRGMFKRLRDKSAQPSDASLHMPPEIPTCADWSEFHLGGLQRLIGFMMPGNLHGEKFPDIDSEFTINKNTFYVVFFDGGHDFWPAKKKHT